jgi:hypothetical protein
MSAQIGTIIHGTCRSEDLIPAFAAELATHDADNALIAEAAAFNFDSEHDAELTNDLIDALSEHAPPYAYFGSHEGDGSDYGFWPDIESLEDSARHEPDCVLKVSDTGDVPSTFRGYVMHVNDHGNVTLYCAQGRDLTEIWACV